MSGVRLSVIIPTFNRVPILLQTLHKIFSPEIDFDREKMEVIVVNDGTQDISFLLDLFAGCPLRVIKNRGRGAASARNTGASHAQGEMLLFQDDDILPTEGYFQRHMSVCEKYPNSISVANCLYPEELIAKVSHQPFGRYRLKYEYDWKKRLDLKGLEDGLYAIDSVASFSCIMHKSTYLDLGGYNESFPYAGCEDAEFAYRARKKGYTLIFDEKNICYHNEMDRFDLSSWLRRQATGIKTAVIMCKLHPEGMNHPTWYTNTPLSRKDPIPVMLLKIKKFILSRHIVLISIFRITHVLENINIPDGILFRLYNALWLGYTYRSFQETYHEVFKK